MGPGGTFSTTSRPCSSISSWMDGGTFQVGFRRLSIDLVGPGGGRPAGFANGQGIAPLVGAIDEMVQQQLRQVDDKAVLHLCRDDVAGVDLQDLALFDPLGFYAVLPDHHRSLYPFLRGQDGYRGFTRVLAVLLPAHHLVVERRRRRGGQPPRQPAPEK